SPKEIASMRNAWLWLLAGCAVLAAVSPPAPGAAAKSEGRYPGADALGARIDKHLKAGWDKAKVTPARPADDAAVVRRVYLDLAGRIPSVTEVRQFLADKSPDKRARLVEKLLEHPRYVTHFTAVYRALLLPEASTSFQLGAQAGGFEAWLRGQLAKNAGWDKIATELLTAPVAGGRGGPFAGGGAGPGAFYFAKEFKPEELAGAAGRLFLGVNIGCAQCHHHPFASWKREQFWGFAAFFGGIQSRRMGDFSFPTGEDPSKREIT